MKSGNVSILGSRGIPAMYGGFETFAENLSIGLAAEGYDVYVYCPKYQNYQEATYKNVKLVFIDNYEYLFKSRVLRAISNVIFDINCLWHASSKDMPHNVYMLGYSAGVFLVLPRLFGKRLILNPDGLEWKSTRWGWFARSWLYFCEFISTKFANKLVGDAEPITHRFREKYNADITTVEYGTDLFECNGLNLEYPKHSYYLAVARMVPETKVDVIIKGFKKAKIQGKILLVIGPIADRDFFDAEISPQINGCDVVYLGSIYDKSRLNKLRANAVALIHGHASDGTNPSLLESMGCASPVISMDRDSNVKVLTRENAFYFENEYSLAQAILDFEKLDNTQRRMMGEKNQKMVKESFSWGISVAAHQKIFHD